MRFFAVTTGLLNPTCGPPFADHVSALLSLNRAPVHRAHASPTSAPSARIRSQGAMICPPELEPALLRPAKPLAPEPNLGQCDYGEACIRAVFLSLASDVIRDGSRIEGCRSAPSDGDVRFCYQWQRGLERLRDLDARTPTSPRNAPAIPRALRRTGASKRGASSADVSPRRVCIGWTVLSVGHGCMRTRGYRWSSLAEGRVE